MKAQILNGQDGVEVQIIAEDGTPLNVDLLPNEVLTFERIDRTLKSNPVFQSAYPNARLIRIDSNRGIKEDEAGRYYLRYQYDSGITEFWGHYTSSTYIDCDQGLVGIAKWIISVAEQPIIDFVQRLGGKHNVPARAGTLLVIPC